MRNGISPQARSVIKAIVWRGKTVPQIEKETRLRRRQVLAQVNWLKEWGAVRVAGYEHQRGDRARYAVYSIVLHQL